MQYIEHNEELFDIQHDLHETSNLAGDPKCKRKLEELRCRYKELKKEAL
jgi:hypothetical protein